MALVKCPRCELNYILDGGELCTVCRKEVRGESEPADLPELCSECGENPAVPGGELCLACLKEMNRRSSSTSNDDMVAPDSASIGIDSVSTMDEIELDIDDGAGFDDEEFKDDEEKKGSGEDEVLSIQQLAEQEEAEAEAEADEEE